MEMGLLFCGFVAAMAIAGLYLERPTRRSAPLGIRYILTKTADGRTPPIFGSSDPQNTVTTLADSLSHSVHSPHFNTTMYISPIMLPTKNGSMIHGIIATHLPFISLLESNGTRAIH
jgi:hypothetical protein